MLSEKAKNIKLLITDVDGVMTDGSLYYGPNGEELKRFNVKDGMSVAICRDMGIEYGIISAGHSDAMVRARAKDLKIDHVYVGKSPKIDVLKEWLETLNLSADQVAYIGDDVKDIEVMQLVGLSACPADAVQKVTEVADIVLKRNGGTGCVREFVENHLVSNR